MVSKFKNSVLVQIDRERDPKNFFQIELWVDIHIFFKSTSELVSQFKNSVLVQKSINSAIQALFLFFQIELWARYFFVFRSSSELVSKFKNSVLVQKSIKIALLFFFDPSTFIFFQIELWGLRYFFVFRSSSELVSKFKNSVLVQKSINSAIQALLFFFRLSSGFVIFLYSDRAQSWFLNSKILF